MATSEETHNKQYCYKCIMHMFSRSTTSFAYNVQAHNFIDFTLSYFVFSATAYLCLSFNHFHRTLRFTCCFHFGGSIRKWLSVLDVSELVLFIFVSFMLISLLLLINRDSIVWSPSSRSHEGASQRKRNINKWIKNKM